MIRAATLSRSRTGRCFLHLACAFRRPRTTAFQLAGLARDLIGPDTSTYYPSPSPLIPLAVMIAVALMAWWSLR